MYIFNTAIHKTRTCCLTAFKYGFLEITMCEKCFGKVTRKESCILQFCFFSCCIIQRTVTEQRILQITVNKRCIIKSTVIKLAILEISTIQVHCPKNLHSKMPCRLNPFFHLHRHKAKAHALHIKFQCL